MQRVTMRNLTWVKTVSSESWGCSKCTWTFNSSGPPNGNSLDEMKLNYERQRDKEFASHVCMTNAKTNGQKP
ncbi:MAG: hypothetical protein PVS2B2_23120 [Candidatus Acidiferrum sp.]